MFGSALLAPALASAVVAWGVPPGTYPFLLTPGRPLKLVAGTNGAGVVEIDAIDGTLFIHRSTGAQAITSNGLVVLTERGLLLVDTAWTDAEIDAILAWGGRRVGRPWIGAVGARGPEDGERQ